MIQSAAEIYESFFVPALFNQWPPIIADLLDVKPNSRVLDFACGTGVLACYMSEIMGSGKNVSGIDINDGMLSVARQKDPSIDWQNAQAEKIPFKDNSYDIVVSQFGLMFFEYQEKAIKEMLRVLQPHGMFAIVVWGALDDTPGYAAVTDLIQRLFGKKIANEIRVPFNLGDKNEFHKVISSAGMDNVKVSTHEGVAKFKSISEWIYTDIKGWTFAGKLNDEQFELLLKEAQITLKSFVGPDGSASFSAPAHIALVGK